MKTLHTLAVAFAFLALLSSCKSTAGQMQDLSNKETRKGIMNAIANDSMMSQEMIGTMRNSKNGGMMMQKIK